MAPSSNLVFEETSTYIRTACPGWCTLPLLHPVDNGVDGGVGFRIHGSPHFGKHLHGYGEEYIDEPGVLYVGLDLFVEDPVTMAHLDLEQLAAHIDEARAWLSDVLRQDNVKPVQVRR